jgi:hypothetical protein
VKLLTIKHNKEKEEVKKNMTLKREKRKENVTRKLLEQVRTAKRRGRCLKKSFPEGNLQIRMWSLIHNEKKNIFLSEKTAM